MEESHEPAFHVVAPTGRVDEPGVPRLFTHLQRYDWLNYGNRVQTTGAPAPTQ